MVLILNLRVSRNINMLTHSNPPLSTNSSKRICDTSNSFRLLVRPSLVYLVSSLGRIPEKGQYINVAPYSLVMEASHKPPRMLIAVRENNDTYLNIRENKDFVLNLCSPDNLDTVISTSAKIPRGESEIDYVRVNANQKLTPFCVKSIKSEVPGILEAPINIWCRLSEGLELSYSELCYDIYLTRPIFIADVLGVVADSSYIKHHFDLEKLNPQKPLLLSYGAGKYGETRVCDSFSTDSDYQHILKIISQEQVSQIPKSETLHCSVGLPDKIKTLCF